MSAPRECSLYHSHRTGPVLTHIGDFLWKVFCYTPLVFNKILESLKVWLTLFNAAGITILIIGTSKRFVLRSDLQGVTQNSIVPLNLDLGISNQLGWVAILVTR